MAAFLALAALLGLVVLAALLRPLWRDARGPAIGVAVAVLASAALLYRIVGTPAALDPDAVRGPQTLQDAIVRLQSELKRNPDQPEGWRLLGQALSREDRLPEAREAYAEAARRLPRDPTLLVEAAQARALADDAHRFDAEAVALLQRALEIDAAHQRARWFLGVARRQAGRNADAAATWEPLLAQVDATTAASLRKEIDNARADAGLPPLPPAQAPAPAAGLEVKVALDPDFAARVRLRGDATVFVIARQPGGPPMPVAVEKHAVSELPLSVVLDDGDSPMPTLKLSQLGEVEVFARISSSGEANRQDGDIESQPVQVKLPDDKPVELLIGSP